MSTTDFSSLELRPDLLKNLSSLGYLSMTPVQAESLPHILSAKDVIAQAKTGSGKTAAFGLGLLEALDVKRFRVQSLVLCPTRELADQVAKEIRKLARSVHNIKVLTLCGGTPFGPQLGSLAHGAHIIVGTPGRIEEHLRKGTLALKDLNTFVLDEADRMLDMGFQAALDEIISYLPQQRQSLLFSATFSDSIKKIARGIMNDPIIIEVEDSHDDTSIVQHFYNVDDITGRGVGDDVSTRLTVLQLLLLYYQAESSVVFCNTKRETQEVANELHNKGFDVLALHGDLEQRDRDRALVRFANKSISILVATDVAARGLDIDSLDVVFNYHISRELEVHTHRIGRTGRAGNKGIACTLFSEKERYKLTLLEEYLEQTITADSLPPLNLLQQPAYKSEMATLQIDGGKKQKVRPGDILGALTGEHGVHGKEVGKIQLFDNWAYVAVAKNVASVALKKLSEGKLKGRFFRIRRIRG